MSESQPEATPDPSLPAEQTLAPVNQSTMRVLRATRGVTAQQLIDGRRCPTGRYLYDHSTLAALRHINRRLQEVFGKPLHHEHHTGLL